MKVIWSPAAEADLEGLVMHIASNNVDAALRLEDRILATVERLADHPDRGRRGRLANSRELVITRSPYIVIYHRAQDRIDIVRVVHGSQRWPPRPET